MAFANTFAIHKEDKNPTEWPVDIAHKMVVPFPSYKNFVLRNDVLWFI